MTDIIVVGVVTVIVGFGVLLLRALRGNQTVPSAMPAWQRWFVIALIGLVFALIAGIVLRLLAHGW